jgi:hypothetical protein
VHAVFGIKQKIARRLPRRPSAVLFAEEMEDVAVFRGFVKQNLTLSLSSTLFALLCSPVLQATGRAEQ